VKEKVSKKYIPDEYRFLQLDPPCPWRDWKYGFRVQIKKWQIHLKAFT